MVVFILYCKADLEGVESLTLSKDTNLCFSVRNPLDQAETREKIVVETDVLHSPATATNKAHRDEGPHHFAMKWRDGTSRSTLRVLGTNSEIVEDDKNEHDKKTKAKNFMTPELERALGKCREMKAEDNGNLVPMLALDCDGLEPYAFHPLGGEGEFICVGKNGSKYENVDLSDGDWAEYDVSTGSVSITNFTSEFQ